MRWTTVACCAAAAACSDGGPERKLDNARSTASSGGPALLVQDLRTGGAPYGSTPHGFVVASGARAFFVADDGSSGDELWVTNGTGGGTSLVLDIRPGGASALPSAGTRFEAAAFGGGLVFAADDGARGAELWFSDGTAGGTRLVKDLAPGTASSSPRALTVLGSSVYFVATAGPIDARRVELWKTDGTDANTALVAAIGLGETDRAELVAHAGTLYFGGRSGGTPGLWTSTPGGATLPVKSLGSLPASLTVFVGKVHFAAAPFSGPNVVLWSSNGSAAGTQPFTNPLGATDPALFTVLDARLFYAATVGGSRDLFSTDGVAQFRNTTENVSPAAMAAAGGRLFLSAVRVADDAGRELYVWNPFAGNVQLLADATPGPASSNPTSLTTFGSHLLYGASDTSAAAALWQSDGTPAGTSRVYDRGGPEVGEMASLGTFALLAGGDGAGVELWRSDRTASGTSAVANLRPDFASALPEGLTRWSDRLFFSADGELSGTPVGRELWTSAGGGADLVRNIFLDGATPASSSPADLVATGAGILFTASDPNAGRELWSSNGASLATSLVKDIDPSFVVGTIPRGGVQSPAWLTGIGSSALFAADGGASSGNTGRELWVTDGTAGGTALLKDLNPGPAGSFPTGLTQAGGAVWFSADDGDSFLLSKIYRSDGTAAGTIPAPELDCVAGPVYSPRWFADLIGTAVFAAESDFYPGAVKLFRYDEGSGCVRRVIDDVTYFDRDPVDPVAFAVYGGMGWFGAREASGYVLWKTDGFPAGTQPVARLGTLGGGGITSIAGMDGLLYLIANDEQHGDELWTFDPASGATILVKDAYAGPVGSAGGSALFPVPARGRVLYAADDGASGRELWISDGSVLGTRLLQDLRGGPASSNPAGFTAVGDLVYFTADDGATGRELWVLDTSEAALDLTPPVPHCPAGPILVEATRPSGADPSFAITASDDRPEPVTLSYDPPSGLTPVRFGETMLVTATAADGTGNLAQCVFSVQVRDTLAPTLTCPDDRRVEATTAAGAAVTFEATAIDTVAISPTVTYSIASGSTFPLGAAHEARTTAVSVNASDETGNGSACAFQITVSDTTPPAITCPVIVPVEATSLSGAASTWGDATATDAVTPVGSIVVAYSAARGATFPLGTTDVRATATDWADNVASCGIAVRVIDTTPPTISCPIVARIEATSPSGAAATFAATASDLATVPRLAYTDVAGTYLSDEPVTAPFPIAVTSVTATATDGFNGPVSCQFVVTVQDTTAPAPACPASPILVEATDAGGATVPLTGAVTATDAGTTAPAISYAPASGSRFPLQASKAATTTRVTATASDDAGNAGACSFDVVVRDTTPPAATRACGIGTYALFQEATGPAGAIVDHPRDFVDLVTTTADLQLAYEQDGTGTPYPSGVLRPIGSTAVAARATDEAGNVSAACAFTSTVRDTTPPVPSCPASLVVEATGPAGAAASWADATGLDVVTPIASITVAAGLVSYDALQGGVFPLTPIGTTTVTATVRDEFANAASCQFTVTVEDTTPPSIACPALEPFEAGSPVAFAALAMDSVTAVPVVAYSHAPSDPFPLGTTAVTATATDERGNEASCILTVVVVDTTPPTISCPALAPFEAGTAVAFAALATDSVTAVPVVTYSRAPSDPFPVGTTSVTATATDERGNAASCVLTVVVVDTTPPTITCPALVSFEAGTAVTFEALASDLVTAVPVVTYSHAPSDPFPLGTTSVTATATDERGNEASCVLTVVVVDTISPVVACPTYAPVEATGPAGAQATFAATATDAAATPQLSYSGVAGTYLSGEAITAPFPFGLTRVTATASDGRSTPATCEIDITVHDTTAPAPACPAPLLVEATDAGGATVSLAGVVTAVDAVTAAPAVSYSPASGSRFALQASKALTTTRVTATATDGAANAAQCGFDVVVRDTTPPTTTRACGAGTFAVFHEATGPGGAVVDHPRDFVDLVTTAAVLQLAYVVDGSGTPYPSGALRPIGSTAVAARATDEAGNVSAVCAFTSTVRDTTPPIAACPAGVVVEATGPAGAVATWGDATGFDLVTPAASMTVAGGLVSYDAVNGGVFPLEPSGTTTVTATVRDGFANAASCQFTVTVEDTTPPAIACPALEPFEAGSAIAFAALAFDAVAIPVVAYSHAPSDPFPIGTTAVIATATDGHGNGASCAISVVVVDTTPPAITCPANVSASGGGGAAVTFPMATATDAGDPAPAITSTRASGSFFPVGTTDVAFTATDGSGNSASCTMTVSVADPPESGGGGGGCATGSGGAAALLGLLAAVLRRRSRRSAEPPVAGL